MYAVQRVSVVDVAFGGGPSFSDVFQQTMGEVALPEIPQLKYFSDIKAILETNEAYRDEVATLNEKIEQVHEKYNKFVAK